MSIWACAICQKLLPWQVSLLCPKCGAKLNYVQVQSIDPQPDTTEVAYTVTVYP